MARLLRAAKLPSMSCFYERHGMESNDISPIIARQVATEYIITPISTLVDFLIILGALVRHDAGLFRRAPEMADTWPFMRHYQAISA